MKALIISVGTGISPTEKAVKSLVNALAFSINHHNPDMAFFVVSKQSQKVTLPRILRKTKLKNYKVLTIRDPDSIEQIYEELQPKFKRIKQRYDQITVDYTSGTKAMTSALTILGTVYEADTLSYITGKRKGGIVQAGTEELRIIQPYFVTMEQKIKVAIQFFNKNQFNAAIAILNQIEKTTADPKITNRTNPLKSLAKAYALWDKFQHRKAFEIMKTIEKEELAKNKRFLGQLVSKIDKSQNPEPYYIADLMNNAKRRGTDEKRYDDAVARLYRTIELIAQYKLKTKHRIDTSQAKQEQIPKQLLEKWGVPPNTQKVKLTLEKDYELLNAKNEPLGTKFAKDGKLKNLLSKRNSSILAHNLIPINRKTYTELHRKAFEYASLAVKNLTQLIEDAAFVKFC